MSRSQYQHQELMSPVTLTLSHSPIYTHADHPFSSSKFTSVSSSYHFFCRTRSSAIMGARLVHARGAAVIFGALVVLSAVVSFGAAALTPTVVVGSVKCLDCSPNDVNAEDAFKGKPNCFYTSRCSPGKWKLWPSHKTAVYQFM
jgi:hypothetical protein